MRQRKHMKRYFDGSARWMRDGLDFQEWEHGVLEELTDAQILRYTTASFWISDLDYRSDVITDEQIRIGIQRGELREENYDVFVCDWPEQTSDPDALETKAECDRQAREDLIADAI